MQQLLRGACKRGDGTLRRHGARTCIGQSGPCSSCTRTRPDRTGTLVSPSCGAFDGPRASMALLADASYDGARARERRLESKRLRSQTRRHRACMHMRAQMQWWKIGSRGKGTSRVAKGSEVRSGQCILVVPVRRPEQTPATLAHSLAEPRVAPTRAGAAVWGRRRRAHPSNLHASGLGHCCSVHQPDAIFKQTEEAC